MSIEIVLSKNAEELGAAAASFGIKAIAAAIERKGHANIIVATGASQFATLEHLTESWDFDWSLVTGFHLDEYLGTGDCHPASFRRYLKERFVDLVPLKQFHYVDGDASDPSAECDRLGKLIAGSPIDVAFVGIGENGHLAFNDPPADFDNADAYSVVELDDACRKQQFGEGWFDSIEEVPKSAISMSCRQILLSDTIVCSVPDQRKAEAVRNSVEGPVSAHVPASILQTHKNTKLFLDESSASQLNLRAIP